jgi:hypothetical protein
VEAGDRRRRDIHGIGRRTPNRRPLSAFSGGFYADQGLGFGGAGCNTGRELWISRREAGPKTGSSSRHWCTSPSGAPRPPAPERREGGDPGGSDGGGGAPMRAQPLQRERPGMSGLWAHSLVSCVAKSDLRFKRG